MTTAVFVYGTLREDCDLARLLPADANRFPATAQGKLHYSPHTRGYPVFVRTDNPDDQVVGDLMWLDLNNGDVAYTVIMELQAGYSAEYMPVYYDGEQAAAIEALVFTWNPANGLGQHIPSGDWTFETHPDNGDEDYSDYEDATAWGGPYYCMHCGEEYPRSKDALECEWLHDSDARIFTGHNY